MGRKRQNPTTPAAKPVPQSKDQVVGRHFLRRIEEQLQQLHEMPAHGNRDLFFDQLAVGHLIAFFNPGVRGLRTIEDIFDDPEFRKRLGASKMSKSAISDAQSVFDPELLLPIIESLRERTGGQPHDTRLDIITRELIAVDGSFFTVAPRIAWALFNGSGKGNVRLHVQFNVFDGLPDHVTLTDGQSSETKQLRDHLKPECFYVLDRGFHDYSLFKDIIEAKSDFLVRLRKTSRAEPLEERPLTSDDIKAGIQRDALVRLGKRQDRMPELPTLRLVEVRVIDRDGQASILRLLTNRLGLPAWMIALIYQYRWQVELFFRWLKCMAHFNHFFAESQRGMTLQVYVTMIGLLLIALETGAKPSKYDYAMMTMIVSGQIELDSGTQIMARLAGCRGGPASSRAAKGSRMAKSL